MPSGSDKWIRSIKDNPAGKVVADPEGNRWEWQSDDETSHLLKKLNNDELSIEKTDLRPTLKADGKRPPHAPKRAGSTVEALRGIPAAASTPTTTPGKPKRARRTARGASTAPLRWTSTAA